MQHQQMLHEKLNDLQTWSGTTQHVATRRRYQHFNATFLGVTMARLATLLQGRRITLASSHLTSRRRKNVACVFA